MSVIQRTGMYGFYYGSTYNSSSALSSEQKEVNAKYIYSYFKNIGWTTKAIASILGNMDAESSLNPGRWQSEFVGNNSGGYGLVQWTPATKYFNWCEDMGFADPSEMENNLDRINYEFENNLQWISTNEYNLSFEEFSKSNQSITYLTTAFLKCYERAGIENLDYRIERANFYYSYLTGEDPNDPIEPDNPVKPKKKKNKKYKFVLFKRKVFY